MSTSRSVPTNVRLNSVTFSDNTVLTSASIFTTNLRGRKRLRIDGDSELKRNLIVGGNATVEGDLYVKKTINFEGNVPYVDNQTGWGLPEWTFFAGTFNKQTDSLIIKITTLEEMIAQTYATKSELTSATTLNNGLIYAPSGTYPLYNQPGYYTKGVTHLASNTYFIIRDSIEYPQVMQFQRGEVEVGHYLRCADDQGTVEWAALGNDIPVLTGINTSNGPSTSASFYVTDDVGGTRGTYFYPNMDSQGTNSFNSKLQTGDISLLAGQGNAQNGSTPYALFVGPFNGYQGLRMVSDTIVNGATVRGSSVLSGGQPEQLIELLSGRIRFKSGAKNPIYIEMTSGTLNSIPQGPFHIVGTLWPKDPSPVMIVTKQLSSMSKLSFMVNPTLNEGNWNDVVQDGDTLLYTANTSYYDPTESFPNVFTDNTTSTHLGVWSNYADALSVRQTIISEETSPVSVNNSGFIRLSACTSIDQIQNPQMTSKNYRIPRDYLMMDREGLTVKLQNSKVYQIFGKVQIKNKTSTRLNDLSTTPLTATFEVGTSSSNVSSNFNGLLKYFYSGLTNVQGYILSADDNLGTVKWKTSVELFPSSVNKDVTFTKTVTFQDTIKYTKNLPSMGGNKLFALGNDGTNGNVRWIEIPVAENGEVEQPITFKDTIELYNQMFWINVDFGLLTAAAVGGIAYAIGKGSLADQKKGGQFWNSNDPGLTFYWRYVDENVGSPPYTYTCKMDKNSLFGKIIKVADSFPPASDFDQTSITDLQFFQSNKVVTDSNPVTLNGITSTVQTTKPGRLLIAGYVNYRNPQTQNIFSQWTYAEPSPGDILINIGSGYTYTPPGSESQYERYGQAEWRRLHEVIPSTWVTDQYFKENIYVGSESDYITNLYGVSGTVSKNQSNLSIFGRLFFRSAVGDNDTGYSPLNYYLKCSNATTGEVMWAPAPSTIPDNISCTTLSVSGNSSFFSGSFSNVVSFSETATFIKWFKLTTDAAVGKVLTCGDGLGTARWEYPSYQFITLNVSTQATINILNVTSTIKYVPGAALNRVLTCTNASTGTAEWRDLGQTTLPSDPTFNSIAVSSSINLTNHITTVKNSGFTVLSAPIDALFPVRGDTTSIDVAPTPNTVYNSTYRTVYSGSFTPSTVKGWRYTAGLWIYWKFSRTTGYNFLADFQSDIQSYTYQVIDNGTQQVLYSATIPVNNIMYMQFDSYTGVHDLNNLNTVVETYFYCNDLDFSFTNMFTDDIRIDISIKSRHNFNNYINPVNITNISTAFIIGNKDPYQYTLVNDVGGTNLGFYGSVSGEGSASASIKQWIILKRYMSSYSTDPTVYNGGSGGSSNSISWKGYLQYLDKSYKSNGFLPPTIINGENVMMNDVNVTTLTVGSGGLYCPFSAIYTGGMAGRKGMGQGAPANVDPIGIPYSSSTSSTPNYVGSYALWGSIFNFYWTIQGKWQIWVDFTLIHESSPNFSDYRIKTNLRQPSTVLDRYCAIPMYQYDFESYGVMPKVENKLGVMAHELQEAFPELPHLVSGEKDGMTEEGKYQLQMVDEKELLMLTMKAVQELREENRLLQTQINLLLERLSSS
jgi:hypothetical protein